MNRIVVIIFLGFLCLSNFPIKAEPPASLENQFRHLPIEARRLTGPLFWLHGDESPERLQMYLQKVAEGGNGCFTAESRPHIDWLGEGWYRDLDICLKAAKQNNLQMWIFDEKWWPSQGVGGQVPPRYAAKRLAVESTDVSGPQLLEASGHSGECYIATVAGRIAEDGHILGDTLIDLNPSIHDGKLSWQIPSGKWKVMKFTHIQAPALGQNAQLSIDGASRDCVDWFIQTVYQPHYDHFGQDFGKTIPGFFYDEPETRGDWGTELNVVLAERNIDWKKVYVAYKIGLVGEEQVAAQFQYLDAIAEAWGRTTYGGMTQWCHEHGVKSIGHFMEHGGLYFNRDYCAGDMMRLQSYSDMGGIDAVFRQFEIGKRVADSPLLWETPKIGSSISHVYGKQDDVAMVEIFGARGQDLTYSEMKWWTDHMQVSGINFIIPHSFNPRAPYDTDCPPYFYNGGFEPRWPLYRVYTDYSSRLTLMLTGGRHVCPVAQLFMGQSAQVGTFLGPEEMATALQDGRIDSDWLPYEVFETKTTIEGKSLSLFQERYKVLIVPPVEVIPYTTLAKVQQFFDAGGIVIGYGMLPSKSATLGYHSMNIASLCDQLWGKDPQQGFAACRTNAKGGRTYYLPEKPTSQQLQQVFSDAGITPTLQVVSGETDGWLHVLHRVKDDHDIFLICNQNHEGKARTFKFHAIAEGTPECWDAMRNDIGAIPFKRIDANTTEFSLLLEPLESVLVVFQKKLLPRPSCHAEGVRPAVTSIDLTREPSPSPARPAAECLKVKSAINLAGCDWVWTPNVSAGGIAPPGKACFRKTISIPEGRKIRLAKFVMTGDNLAELLVNGQSLGSAYDFHQGLEMNMSKALKPGDNLLAMVAANCGTDPNPAGVCGRYLIEFEQGEPIQGTVDVLWKASSQEESGWTTKLIDDSRWPSAVRICAVGEAPWGPISDRPVTLGPVAVADPFYSHFDLPKTKGRIFLEMTDLPDDSASVSVNGQYVGGMIGKPLWLELTGYAKAGENTILIEPLAPKSARIVIHHDDRK